MTTEQKLSRDEHMAVVFQSMGMGYAITRMVNDGIPLPEEEIRNLVNTMLKGANLEPITNYEIELLDSEPVQNAADQIMKSRAQSETKKWMPKS